MDLSQWDDDYREAPVEDRGSVPDGIYQVVVDAVKLEESKKSGTPMLRWKLRILGPTQRGRFVFRNNMIGSAENVKWLKSDLHVAGLVLGKLSDLEGHLEQLLDTTLEVKVRTKGENTNVYFNKRITLTEDGEQEDDGGLSF